MLPSQAILRMRNPVMDYDWGSADALARLQGRTPSGKREAEMWMGAHPRASSEVLHGGRWVPLRGLMAQDPEALLGPELARSAPELPFLFKILAVAQPLSLQAHPDAAQALAGFAREEAAGIPLDSPLRSFVDRSHKPELVCAIGRFHALRGFREPAGIRAAFERFGVAELLPSATGPPENWLRALVERLLGVTPEEGAALVRRAREAAGKHPGDVCGRWVEKLARAYPADPAALAPAFLNRVCLEPGEALYLPAGELHCYLGGLAIELMANSDNVLRGGLTPKHVDTKTLLEILRFEPARIARLRPGRSGGYATPASEFALSVALPSARRTQKRRGPEIVLCTEGRAAVQRAGEEAVSLAPGQSAFVAFSAGPYEIAGAGLAYRAALPEPAVG